VSPIPATDSVTVVTGPTSGIGRATAFALAKNPGTLVLACRDIEKGKAVHNEILQRNPGARVEILPVDLARLRSVREFAATLTARHPRVHVLVNNAGIFMRTRHTTEDGFERVFQVNYLAHFLLTSLLLPSLRSAAPSRIVNVSSEAHRGATIDFDDLQGEKGFSGWQAYGRSKLEQILFTHELARRLDGTGVSVNALHPGVIRTNLGRGEFPKAFAIALAFMKGPEKGARTSVHVATSAAVEGVSGRYFKNSHEARSSPVSYDDADARRLWDVSEALLGLAP